MFNQRSWPDLWFNCHGHPDQFIDDQGKEVNCTTQHLRHALRWFTEQELNHALVTAILDCLEALHVLVPDSHPLSA